MSMTHAQKAILQAIQTKQNCNPVQECKYDDYGDYGDVHGDYYDFDFQEEEVAVRPEQSVKSPMPNILERIKNRLFQNTK